METIEIAIRDIEIGEWLTKKYGSWVLFQDEYRRREKEMLEKDAQTIVEKVDKTFLKEYIQEEIDDSIIEVISFECDFKYGTTHLVKYTKGVK